FAKIDNKAIRVDPVHGLFGLAIVEKSGFLADAANREALSMAIERERLPASFSLSGWTTSTGFLPEQLEMPSAPSMPRWNSLDIEERRTFARRIVGNWKGGNGPIMPLRIALPKGPGSNLLFGIVKSDFAQIGVTAVRVNEKADADLRLIDEVAPYDSAFWYLGRLSCAYELSCSAEATQRLSEAQRAGNIDEMLQKMGEAEALTLAHGGYIPLGAPVRWSLVSRRLRGFKPSARGWHPLNHLLAEPR
ncbi:MAG: ABC transporter substrate-binding protein, partial [Alphaproteobacteria bacterium]|nr:ABC transporter substrate-binding protein [Alphaproteobacteria bacterium]